VIFEWEEVPNPQHHKTSRELSGSRVDRHMKENFQLTTKEYAKGSFAEEIRTKLIFKKGMTLDNK